MARFLAFISALLILTPSLQAQAGPQLRGACFAFSYAIQRGDADSSAFARLVRFSSAGGDSSITSTGFASDTIGFWQMFQAGATWTALGRDSLQLTFTNGFSFVIYDLGLHQDTLLGLASIAFDFGDPDHWPRALAVGHRCG